MASSGSIWVSLGLKTDQFSKGVSKARGQTKGFQKDLGGFQNSVKNLGAAMVGAFAFSSVKSFFSSSLEAYNEQIISQKKLENALGFTSTALEKQASALQGVTRFGDEATIQMQAQLATLGLTEDQIFRLTPLVQDLAAQTGKPLSKAAKEVTSALSTGSTTLAKYGVELTAANSLSENLEITLAGLETSVGGAAQKMANEGSGGAEQLSNAYGDIKESIGKVVSDGLNELTPALLENANAMKAVADDSTLEWWEKLGTIISGTENVVAQINARLVSGVNAATTLQGAYGNTQKTLDNLKNSFNNGEISLEQYKDAIQKVKDAAVDKINTFKPLSKEVHKNSEANKVLTKSEVEAAAKAKRLAAGLKEIDVAGAGLGTRTKAGISAISSELDKTQSDLDKRELQIPVTPKLKIDGEAMNEPFMALNGNMIERGEKAGQALGDAIAGAAAIGFGAIGEALAGGNMTAIGDSLLMSMSGLLSGFGQQMITLGLGMEALKESLALGPLGAGIAIAGGVALLAIAGAIKSSLQEKSTGFAQGGLVTGSVFANVGEGRGTTRANPEVISPLDKLQSMIDVGNQGGMAGEVKFRIEGNTLVGILKRQDKKFKYS